MLTKNLNIMITKQQILDEILKHMTSAYDNGNINDGGIHGGEEAADAILNLLQADVSGSLPLLRETVMRANLAMPENEQDEKWFEEKIDPEDDENFIERVYQVLNLGKMRVDCNDCQGQGCPTCKGYGYWYQERQ